MMLTDDVAEFVDTLVAKYLGIRQVWLIGSRARGSKRQDSDWDLVVFADAAVLSTLRVDVDLPARSTKLHLDLLVVHDGDNFVEPWGSLAHEKRGSLSGWKWHELSDREAEYRGTKPLADGGGVAVRRCKARRVWPP